MEMALNMGAFGALDQQGMYEIEGGIDWYNTGMAVAGAAGGLIGAKVGACFGPVGAVCGTLAGTALGVIIYTW